MSRRRTRARKRLAIGTMRAGKVDAIKHVGHVCTEFFHIYFLPLIPLRSRFEPRGAAVERAVNIPLQWKSVLIGWFRGFGAYSLIAWAGLILVGTSENDWGLCAVGGVGLVVTVMALVASYFSSFVAQASYERARTIGLAAGFSPEKLLLLEVAYGRMTADEADAELAKLVALQSPRADDLALRQA